MSGSELRIESLGAAQDRSHFISAFAQAPFQLRAKEHQVFLHDPAHAKGLLGTDFPFAREHWLIFEGTELRGRIAANLSATDPKRGYIGFFEVALGRSNTEITAQSLLETALGWLRAKGVSTAYGPVNYSTWFPYRFRTDRNPSPVFAWEPVQPPEYAGFWTKLGFEQASYYTSRAYRGGKELLSLTQKGYDRALKAGYRTRPFDLKNKLNEELATIERITKESFQSSFLIEPISPEIYRELYVKPFLALASKYCFFILNPEGREVGYGFVFLDQGCLIWKTLAVSPSEQGKSLSTFFMHASCQQGLADGVKYYVAALVKEEGMSDVTVQKLAPIREWIHEYAVYSRAT